MGIYYCERTRARVCVFFSSWALQTRLLLSSAFAFSGRGSGFSTRAAFGRLDASLVACGS